MLEPLVLLLTFASGQSAPLSFEAAGLLLALTMGRKAPRDMGLMLLCAALASGKATGTPRANWTARDMRAFKSTLGDLGVPLRSLLLMLAAESGLYPHATSGSAWGLNQAQSALLSDAGWIAPAQQFAALSVEQQLPWIRKMMLRQFRWIGYVPTTPIDLFRMQLSPAAARARADVIYDRSTSPANYAGNVFLDRGRDGKIDMADLGAHIDATARSARYKSHLALLEATPRHSQEGRRRRQRAK